MRNTKANGKVPQENEDDTRFSEKPKNICLFLQLHLRKHVLIYNSTDDYTFCDYFKTQGSASDTTE